MAKAPEDPGVTRPRSLWTRRSVLKGVGVASAGTQALLESPALAGPESKPFDVKAINVPVKGAVQILLNINGQSRTVTVEPRTTLLSALRDRLDPPLTGPKLVCNEATCGACSVLLDGKAVY